MLCTESRLAIGN